jgi:hypothetical protein
VDIADYARQFAYDEWANREVVGTMQSTGADERSLALLAHILSAERLWLERIKQQTQNSPVWPKASLENCAAQIEEMGLLWREYLSGIARKSSGRRFLIETAKASSGQVVSATFLLILSCIPHIIADRLPATCGSAGKRRPIQTSFTLCARDL